MKIFKSTIKYGNEEFSEEQLERESRGSIRTPEWKQTCQSLLESLRHRRTNMLIIISILISAIGVMVAALGVIVALFCN